MEKTGQLPSKNQLFDFEFGDVRVLVTYNDTPVFGMVASQAMALASPVWKKFLFPPWQPLSRGDSRPDLEFQIGEENDTESQTVKQIDCRQDDGNALLLLLNIAHLRFKEVPVTLPYDQLLHVAVLVDQYNCPDLARPWLNLWLADETKESKAPEHENWLFIAWVFGREKIFEDLARKMVKEIVMSDSGPLTLSDKPILQPMPLDIIESILAVRRESIKKLLDIPYKRIARYEDTKTTICTMGRDGEACDALVYGSLTRGLQRADLWPRTTPEDVKISVGKLCLVLKGLSIFSMGSRNHDYHYGHYSSHAHCCSVDEFRQQVEAVLSTICNPVLDSHRQHMEAQKSM